MFRAVAIISEQRRAAFVASLEAAVGEGERGGFRTAEDVERAVQSAINAASARAA
jgi:hypothetical protein